MLLLFYYFILRSPTTLIVHRFHGPTPPYFTTHNNIQTDTKGAETAAYPQRSKMFKNNQLI